MAAEIFREGLLRARRNAEAELAKGGPNTAYWQAAIDSIDATLERADTLGEYAGEKLRDLVLLALQAPGGIRESVIHQMNAEELIAAMRSGTAELDADTARRAEQAQSVVGLVEAIGNIWLRAALNFVLPA
jgi:hypothetical protein